MSIAAHFLFTSLDSTPDGDRDGSMSQSFWLSARRTSASPEAGGAVGSNVQSMGVVRIAGTLSVVWNLSGSKWHLAVCRVCKNLPAPKYWAV